MYECRDPSSTGLSMCREMLATQGRQRPRISSGGRDANASKGPEDRLGSHYLTQRSSANRQALLDPHFWCSGQVLLLNPTFGAVVSYHQLSNNFVAILESLRSMDGS
jgi:hypothetical protein